VYIVEKGILKRKDITVSWQNSHDAIISAGLNFKDNLVITPLGQVSSGTPVKVAGQKQRQLARKNKRGES